MGAAAAVSPAASLLVHGTPCSELPLRALKTGKRAGPHGEGTGRRAQARRVGPQCLPHPSCTRRPGWPPTAAPDTPCRTKEGITGWPLVCGTHPGTPQPPQRPPWVISTQPGCLPLASGLRLRVQGGKQHRHLLTSLGSLSTAPRVSNERPGGCDLGFYLKPSSRRVTDPTSARSSSGHKPTK